MLLLASGARAEVTHMNCKFNEGWHKKGEYREDAKSRKDLTLSWDKEKRIIKDSDRNFEPYNTFKDSFRWSHKWTGWYDNYTLNTINGNLTISGYNREEKWETLFYYTCDKTQKKFQMKNLIIFILTFSISFYFPTYSFAYTELECSQLAAKAKTQYAAQKIITECGPRDGFFSKNRDLKCALKAGEANTEYAAQRIISDCQHMIQGYIIQFYHPIKADLPEDIREDWMQWHHEELIRDNKVFETVQLKLDI